MKYFWVFLMVFVFAATSFAAVNHADGVNLSKEVRQAATVRAQQYVLHNQVKLTGNSEDMLIKRSATDDGAGIVHTRFDLYRNGIRVFGQQAIVHVDPYSSEVKGVTSGLKHDLKPALASKAAVLSPSLDRVGAEAYVLHLMGVNRRDLNGNTKLSREVLEQPEMTRDINSELIYYPIEDTYALAWEVNAFVDSEIFDGPQAMIYIIDAVDGSVIKSWNNLHTARPTSSTSPTPGTGTAATGTGRTLYLGEIALNTEYYSSAATYGLVDKIAGNSYTTDMNNKKSGDGTLFTRSNNIFGDFSEGDDATVAADAHMGMMLTYQYYKNVHGRNGIFNDGAGVYSRVHYGRSYNNAFWSDSCKCMTYGDGDGSVLSPLTSIDVAAHEMSHGVCAATADLVYTGESGGLNESNSDIFATCVEFYADNPVDTPDWWIGEVIYTPATPGDALRYMDDPTLDGRSIDNYSMYTSTLDVHYSSGLANNFFYLLANGGTNRTSGLSVTGIGISKAEQIWYVALTGYMTSTTDFSGARVATVDAAIQLYGTGSAEVAAVESGWTACGVY